MLAGRKRERGKGKREDLFTLSPLHEAPEWNSLCWLVEREMERERGRLPFERKRD
jgi:hypothetical protein